MSYGDVIDLYAAACRAAGYDENTDLDDPDFAPASSAHKSFYLIGTGKDGEQFSGNSEWARQRMELVVIYLYPAGASTAASEKANWNLFDSLERKLWTVASTNNHAMQVDDISTARVESHKVFKMNFSVGYGRSLAG